MSVQRFLGSRRAFFRIAFSALATLGGYPLRAVQAVRTLLPLKMDGSLTTKTVAGPEWAKNQAIYEVNLDAYGFPKGAALHAFEKHLPILKEMGIGLIWFMPLHPRGYKKGFGSAYSVKDYTEINPDLGTKEEFRRLVNRAHALGIRVLMDWVPNHTAWENPWIESHPDFYVKDATGQIAQAGTWADVAQLNYGTPGHWNQSLWKRMRDDMTFWLQEFGVDGFRCDVAGRAGKVPVEFWNWLRPQLNAVKSVFMLAEGDDTSLHPAFDMTYSWNLPPVLWDICAGRKPASAIDDVLKKEARDYPPGAIRMRFLDNHDWHSHTDWGWGDGVAIDTSKGMPQVAPLMVLCASLPGKPLLYNGQEMRYEKVNPPLVAEARYQSPVFAFYQRLLHLYQNQPALSEGSFLRIASNADDKVYVFVRQKDSNRVLVIVNLSDQWQSVTLSSPFHHSTYRDGFGTHTVIENSTSVWRLEPWAYRVLIDLPGVM